MHDSVPSFAQVDLPEDPNLKGFVGNKPAFVVTPRASDSPKQTFDDRSETLAGTSDAGAPPPLHA